MRHISLHVNKPASFKADHIIEKYSFIVQAITIIIIILYFREYWPNQTSDAHKRLRECILHYHVNTHKE